jgi:acyl dehydratase
MDDPGLMADHWRGRAISGPVRTLTAERLHWYAVSLTSAVAGEPRPAPRNIHTDVDYARSQGWPDVIGDGMIAGNWMQSLLLDTFGADYLRQGEMRVKFIRPIMAGSVVHTTATVTRATPTADGLALSLDLSCYAEPDAGQPLVVGEAHLTIRPGGGDQEKEH